MFQLLQQLEAADRSQIPTSAAAPATWKQGFLLLFTALKAKPCVVVFDEFQWMANYRHELIADLKFVWDGFFATLPGQKLILCGSIASFMVNKVIKSSAFYGRIERFYFSFIQPNLKKIRSDHSQTLFAAITQTGAWHVWMGRSFEYLCLQHADLISRQLGFSGIDFTVGPYFAPTKRGRVGVQVDLVFDRADGVLSVCEMKYSRRPVGTEVIADMERKVQFLQRAADRKTIQRILIVHKEPSPALLKSGYFYRIIDASRLFSD